MCTAVAFQGQDFYFGRTLDLECSYGEQIVITPRNLPFAFRFLPPMPRHFALIGTAHVVQGQALYYEAANERGLAMAGLNFPASARYHAKDSRRDNVASFEFIPWVLGQCATLGEAKALLERVNIVDEAFSPSLPPATLHWMIASREGSVVVESTENGLQVYDDPVGVMTNEPPFPMQMFNLSNYMKVSACPPVNHLAPDVELTPYCRGMGGIGLPGDLSSPSRFVRAAFTRLHSVCQTDSEASCVSQFFHILDSVAQTRGCVQLEDGQLEMTVYSCCCNATQGIYYYTTYENPQITAVHLHHVDLEGDAITAYPMLGELRVLEQN